MMKVESSGLMYLSRIGGQIVVPFFQRQYVWKQEQWERLLDNLLEQLKKEFIRFGCKYTFVISRRKEQ